MPGVTKGDMKPIVRRLSATAAAFAWISLIACSGTGSYVWVNDVPAEPVTSEYLIAVGDVVSVRVLNQDAMTTRGRVRADGRIALPILGDVEVRGKRPSALRAELEARYKDFFNAPSVTLNVDELQPLVVAVLGEVSRPGNASLEPNASVAQALAFAGGLTEFADRDRIFVVRSRPAPARIRFTYEALSRGEGHAATFALHVGDVVVVE